MPRPRIRRSATGASAVEPTERTPVRVGSPPWLAPLMCAMFLLGLLWIVVYYLSETRYPIGSIGAFNMAIGFGFILAGFGLSTQWR